MPYILSWFLNILPNVLIRTAKSKTKPCKFIFQELFIFYRDVVGWFGRSDEICPLKVLLHSDSIRNLSLTMVVSFSALGSFFLVSSTFFYTVQPKTRRTYKDNFVVNHYCHSLWVVLGKLKPFCYELSSLWLESLVVMIGKRIATVLFSRRVS